MVTYYVIQTFQRGKKGMLIADQPRQARDANHCVYLAEKLALKAASVVAFSRSGDPANGDWEDAIILATYGDLPIELVDAIAA